MVRCIKKRLSQNDCFNRGFVFNDPQLGDKDLEAIFGILSKKKLKRKLPKEKKKPKQPDAPVVDSSAQPADDGADAGGDADGDPADGQEEQQDDGADPQDSPDAAADADADLKDPDAGEEEQPADDNDPDDADADNADGEDGPKHEFFLPESFIFFEADKTQVAFTDEKVDPRKESIVGFCDKLKLEYSIVDLNQSTEFEGLEDLRLYIERVA